MFAALLAVLGPDSMAAGSSLSTAAFTDQTRTARTAAMAGACAALSDDSEALTGNPSGLALDEFLEFSWTHGRWGVESNYDHLVAVVPMRSAGTLGASLTGFRIGPAAAGFGSWAVAFARGLGRSKIGVTARGVRATAATGAHQDALAFDLGWLLVEPFERLPGLSVGATAQNLGLRGAAFGGGALPPIARVGGGYSSDSWVALIDVLYAPGLPLDARLGAEWSIPARRFTFALRGGASIREGPSAGAGIAFEWGRRLATGIDYAFTRFGFLGPTHRFTLTFHSPARRGNRSFAPPTSATPPAAPAGPPDRATPDAPPAYVASYPDEQRAGRIVLRWSPAKQFEHAGYHLYLSPSEEGPFERLTDAPARMTEYVVDLTGRREPIFASVQGVDLDRPERATAKSAPIRVGREAPGQSFEVKKQRRRLKITLDNLVLFDTGKTALKPESLMVLRKVLALIRTFPPGTTVTVAGHTDSQPIVGELARLYPNNQALSEARAYSIKEWLAGEGVARGNLMAEGFGDSRPVYDNATEAGRMRNRRVEIFLEAPAGAPDLEVDPEAG